MAEVTPFPFATLGELKDRWPDFPAGGDAHAVVLLEDASQFILDVCPPAISASASSRRRVVCAVVRRSMGVANELSGLESLQQGAGSFQQTARPVNPHGDFYLTKQEKVALGDNGKQKAFGVQVVGPWSAQHQQWCSLAFNAMYCSCGVDIAGEPIFEAG